LSQDDLGAALLDRHPRRGVWQQLDVTVANLTFDQTALMAQWSANRGEREAARTRVLDALGEEVAGRLGSRWVRWADTFGLPLPDLSAPPAEQLAHPYQPAGSRHEPDYRDALLPIFDAALGIIGAPGDSQGEADYDVLSAPWQRACLPSRFTSATAFGRHTQAALAVLRFADGMPSQWLGRMTAGRSSVDDQVWQAACVDVEQASLAAGYPYRVRSLYWEAVPAAEQAAGESPTSRELVEALWGAAAAQAFAGQLSKQTTTTLCAPYRASGAVLPG
jgi:hypothetical protein